MEACIAQVRKMRLGTTPTVDLDTGSVSEDEITDDKKVEEVARHLVQAAKQSRIVRGVVQSEDEHPSQVASNLREELMREYSGRVFRDRVWPNPPARGTHGTAVLHLKPGAVPVVGRVIHLKGERLEALKAQEHEFRADAKIESFPGCWYTCVSACTGWFTLMPLVSEGEGL